MRWKDLLYPVRCVLFDRKFRRANQHNELHANSLFEIDSVIAGRASYGSLTVRQYNKSAKLHIGNYCSIADNVTFLLGGEHDYKRISTYPFQSKVYKQEGATRLNRDIVIEDDVWIGYGCTILGGVTVGKGSVVAAGSVVAKNIPPYSVFIQNKVYKNRFPDEIVTKLIELDYSEVDHEMGDSYESFCQIPIDENNVDEIIRVFTGKS